MIVLGAVMIPVFLLIAALVLDVGNWYTHKRQLQNRADAGAFAAGVEYQRAWEDCVQGGNPSLKLDTAKTIANAAREYAGDAEAADYEPTPSQPSPSTLSKYNTQIANQANVDVTINSNSPTYDDDLDYKDGAVGDRADPCYNHPGDAISPSGGYWTDVKVKERNLPSLFGRLGLPLSRNGARARMEIRPTVDKGFLPLGIADSQVSKLQVRLYKDCGNGAEIARADLVKLPKTRQIDPSMSLWAKYDATSDTVGSTAVPIPQIGDCGDPPPESVPVRVEVRIASREAVDITNPSCATLAAARYADCWAHLSHLRVYDGGGSPNARPVVRKIDLTSSGVAPDCAPDAYFARLPQGSTNWTCRMGASVAVDWGTRVDRPNTAFRVSVEGRVLQTILQSDIPAGQSEVTFQGTGIDSPTAPPGGANPVSVKLEWLDIDPTHHVGGPTTPFCTSNPATTPCTLYTETHQTAHQTFVGTDANAGIVELVRLSLSPVSTTALPDPVGSVPAAPSAIEPPAQLYFTVGLRNNLTFGRFTVVRAGDPQANNSLVCDPDYTNGKTYQMFRYGCQPPYSTNTLAIQDVSNPPAEWTFWWDTASAQCPPSNQWLFKPYAHTPWRCLATEPGFRPGQISDGIA
ncbi:MAG TPA: Tad domain-containing protein, partial [Rhodothermales bacterium]|nr:Tad domain-containing protein [Rhodothermales bacterium]